MRSTIAIVALVTLGVGVVGCSSDDDTDTPEPTSVQGGINGPAVVDPSYDPFAVDTTTAP